MESTKILLCCIAVECSTSKVIISIFEVTAFAHVLGLQDDSKFFSLWMLCPYSNYYNLCIQKGEPFPFPKKAQEPLYIS
jgi:hypothetical protein